MGQFSVKPHRAKLSWMMTKSMLLHVEGYTCQHVATYSTHIVHYNKQHIVHYNKLELDNMWCGDKDGGV